ncbi:MAG: sigma factor-like helix-turn-helix DNA-binding protein, partial [Patescibacteria group bacterium]
MNNSTLSLHPEVATKQLLGVLPKRTRDIVEFRFGLGKNSERMTLEAIGNKYNITRERVRQIEADALSRIRKSSKMSELRGVFAD